MESQRRVRLGLKRLHVGGHSWREIGEIIGRTRGSTWYIAHGGINLSKEDTERILGKLPDRLFWKGPKELDGLVLEILKKGNRVVGREMARLLGTTGQTIRKSIKRLREAGHEIDGSMVPPRGYRLRND